MERSIALFSAAFASSAYLRQVNIGDVHAPIGTADLSSQCDGKVQWTNILYKAGPGLEQTGYRSRFKALEKAIFIILIK